jgi:DNA end-binding protein Ku
MRPIWKGQISFGLINIPILLYSAEKPKEVKFSLLDNRNKAKIHYERINDETGEEVPWNDIVKGYEYSKNNYVVMEDKDFEQAAIENTQTFEIQDFIESKSIDCTYFEKPYYLVPTKTAQKGYVLLREVLQRTNRVAIGKVVIRTRQYLGALLPKDDILILNTMRFSEEIKDIAGLDIPKGNIEHYKISPKEFDMAEKLVESMTVKWQPEKYVDDYTESLMKWIDKKVKLGHIPISPGAKEEPSKGGEIVDFMDLLKKSLQKEPRSKGRAAKKETVRTSRRRVNR